MSYSKAKMHQIRFPQTPLGELTLLLQSSPRSLTGFEGALLLREEGKGREEGGEGRERGKVVIAFGGDGRPCVAWFSAIAVSHVTAVKISALCAVQRLSSRWFRTIQQSRAVAEKPRDAVVKLYTYRNFQLHRAVLPAIARLLFEKV